MRLHSFFEFDQPTPVEDGIGGREEGWTCRHKCRADVLYLRGSETVMAGRLSGKQSVVITIHQCAEADEINQYWRARDTKRGVEYNIRTIVPSTNGLWLEMTCESGVAV